MEMITMKKLIAVTLALVMIFALTVTVAAKDSPVGRDYYSITVAYNPSDGSIGTASGDKSSVQVSAPDEDGYVTLTAIAKGDGAFDQWIIEGDYELISGSLTDPVIVIKPKSDINATAKFKNAGSTPDEKSSSKSDSEKPSSGGNDSQSSPKTGDPLWIVLGLAVLALGTGALAVKKIKE